MVLADKGSTPLFLTISYTNCLTWFFSLYKKKLLFGSLPYARRTLNTIQILLQLGLIRSFYFSLNSRITFFPKYFLGEPLIRNYVSLFKNSSRIYVSSSLWPLLLAINPSTIFMFIHQNKLQLGSSFLLKNSSALLIGCVF